MNRLQNYPREKYGLILGTQSPSRPIDPSLVHARLRYSLDVVRYRAINKVPALQHELGAQGIGIAGAWMGIGIHESGWAAGLQAAIALGATMPFPLVSPDRPLPPDTWRDALARWTLKLAGAVLAL